MHPHDPDPTAPSSRTSRRRPGACSPRSSARACDARLIGGMAIRLLAGDRMLDRRSSAPIQDLDFVVAKRRRAASEQLLATAGYVAGRAVQRAQRRAPAAVPRPDARPPDRRLRRAASRCATSCRWPSASTLPPATLPAADVLMTKLQIVELNAKDRGDLYALLDSHEVAMATRRDRRRPDRVADGGRLGPAAHLRAQPRAPARGAWPTRGSTTSAAPSIAGRIEALAARDRGGAEEPQVEAAGARSASASAGTRSPRRSTVKAERA